MKEEEGCLSVLQSKEGRGRPTGESSSYTQPRFDKSHKMAAQDRQLKRIEQERERVQEELNASKQIIKVSEACKTLVEFCQQTEEPLDQDNNKWKTGPNKESSCCSIL